MIDDALNCLFNAFDTDRAGRITFDKLCAGLDILCEAKGQSDMFERGSNLEISFKNTRKFDRMERIPMV